MGSSLIPSWPSGQVVPLTAAEFAQKQRSLGIPEAEWFNPAERAQFGLPAVGEVVVPRGTEISSLRPFEAEEDSTFGPTPTGFGFAGFRGGTMGGFAPGGDFGGSDFGDLTRIFGRGLDIFGDLFGDDVLDGGFVPQRPIPPVPDVMVPLPPQRFPLPPDLGGGMARRTGQVVFDASGRCFIETLQPARTIRRRGRLTCVQRSDGQIIQGCVPARKRMNPLNPRALSRALRRAKAFSKFARKAVRIEQSFKRGRGMSFGRKRKGTGKCRR